FFQRRAKERTNVWNNFFDIFAVGSHQSAKGHITIPYPNLEPLTDKMLDEMNEWALPQIISSRLKAQTEDTYFTDVRAQYCLYCTQYMLAIARQYSLKQWEMQIEFFRSID